MFPYVTATVGQIEKQRDDRRYHLIVIWRDTAYFKCCVCAGDCTSVLYPLEICNKRKQITFRISISVTFWFRILFFVTHFKRPKNQTWKNKLSNWCVRLMEACDTMRAFYLNANKQLSAGETITYKKIHPVVWSSAVLTDEWRICVY